MEATDGIVQGSGMFRNRCRDPGMRKLQQGGSSRRQKQRRLAIDLPTDGIRPEDPPGRTGSRELHLIE